MPPDRHGLADALERLSRDAGDAAAWTLLVEHCGAASERLAQRLCGRADLAQDAVQEAWLQIRDGARRFTRQGEDPDAGAWGWIMRVTATAALQWMRRERRQAGQALAEEPVVPTARSADPERIAAVRQALAGLPEEQHTAVVLHHVEGLDFAMVASAMGCSLQAAQKRAQRGMERLRSHLMAERTRPMAWTSAGIVGCLHALPTAGPTAAGTSLPTLITSGAKPALGMAPINGGLTMVATCAIACAIAATVGGGVWIHAQAADPPPVGPAKPLRVSGEGFGLEAGDGTVSICDAEWKPVVVVSGFALVRSPEKTRGGHASQPANGVLRIDYELSDRMQAYALFSCTGRVVRAEYHLNAPAGTDLSGTMFQRHITGEAKPPLWKSGRWVRHAGGGVPYEEADGIYRRFPSTSLAVWEVVTGDPNWYDATSQHQPWTPAGAADEHLARLEYVVTPLGADDNQAAAIYHRRQLSVSLDTEQPFNLWDVGGEASFTATLGNASASAITNGKIRIAVRDFDGRMVLERNETLSLAPGEAKRLRYAVPGDKPGLDVVEVAATVADTEFFSRTNLAFIKPYAFTHREQSIFGLSAAFPIPSAEAVDGLCRRIGVRWLRHGDTRAAEATFGGVSNHHSHLPLQNDAERKAWLSKSQAKKDGELRAILQACDERRNLFWEYGNEWDMTKSPGMAAEYVSEILKPLARVRAESGSRVQLLSQGFANGFNGVANLKALHDAGGWGLIDGIAYHLGRGNVTPDATVGGWDYLGSLREVKKAIAEFGDKPLYVTEAYACTMPNHWWYDTQRHAAENVVLTYAIGLAEGVKGIFFYQLHDSVWYNQGATKITDPEYHFGMLDRRGAAKPVLLGYATIAQALDGATFTRWMSFPDPKLNGLAFSTPQGPMAVVWDRSDGYTLTEKQESYPSPEIWVDPWKSRKKASFPAATPTVTVIDCIGRRTTVAARNGSVELVLTGAPLIVFGIK